MDNTEQQVKEKIKEFEVLHKKYFNESYNILTDIVNLRKKENPNYNYESLEDEEGLQYYRENIRAIVRYRNLNKKTNKLYSEHWWS